MIITQWYFYFLRDWYNFTICIIDHCLQIPQHCWGEHLQCEILDYKNMCTFSRLTLDGVIFQVSSMQHAAQSMATASRKSASEKKN